MIRQDTFNSYSGLFLRNFLFYIQVFVVNQERKDLVVRDEEDTLENPAQEVITLTGFIAIVIFEMFHAGDNFEI